MAPFTTMMGDDNTRALSDNLCILSRVPRALLTTCCYFFPPWCKQLENVKQNSRKITLFCTCFCPVLLRNIGFTDLRAEGSRLIAVASSLPFTFFVVFVDPSSIREYKVFPFDLPAVTWLKPDFASACWGLWVLTGLLGVLFFWRLSGSASEYWSQHLPILYAA